MEEQLNSRKRKKLSQRKAFGFPQILQRKIVRAANSPKGSRMNTGPTITQIARVRRIDSKEALTMTEYGRGG